MTFPSPDNIESKVRMVAVDGYYDKGKSRQNQAEAQAIVDEIARRLRSEKLRRKSMGVVTFNVVQQALIEDCYPISSPFILNWKPLRWNVKNPCSSRTLKMCKETNGM